MENLVYKFLDKYAGEGLNVSFTPTLYNPYNFLPERWLVFKTDSDVQVIRVKQTEDGMRKESNPKLMKHLIGFIPIDEQTARDSIYNWFCKKHNLNSDEDFLKLLNN
jgi:hypothetical protein